jgi:plasma-membrane proton-efflux P-type ATPase
VDEKTIKTSDYLKVSLQEAMGLLKTNADGLSAEEVKKRLKEFGYNEITEAKKNPLLQFLRRYWGPMPWLLELSMVLTVLLKHYFESIIIFTLLTVNAVIGFYQSRGSQKAVELLKKRLEIKTKVLRDGKWTTVEAKEIVPGDIILTKLGDLVPADVYVISGEISVDESALTGESLPKDLHESDIVYSSSIIKRGEAKCMVVNTGANTYFGKTVELVKIARPKSKQEELMMAIVKYMMYLGVAASSIVSIYALYLHKDILLILSFIVVFLIGAIPVALPAVLTIVQAVGATELSKKGVLVTRLDSIEDAASIDIFCFDKTGTITQNKLSVVDSVPFLGLFKEDVIKMAVLASREEGMDTIDLAIIEYANNMKADLDGYKQISYTPFNPANKMTEATVEFEEDSFRVVKGAVQTVMAMCEGIDKSTSERINLSVEEFSKKGFRTIAVGSSRGIGNNIKFVGLLTLTDPPRLDSGKMIEEIRSLGIKPVMLTGDSIAIAREVAGQVGIGSRIMRIGDLEGLSNEEQLKLIEESDGFAEVYPEDKFKIVKLLQDSGHMVGMTGDGVNDSPALKQAELGMAVSASTDVAKASASIVLTKPGLSEIIDSIKISRKTYQRMLTWVINKITKVTEVVGLLTIGFFWQHDIVISLLGMSLLVFANDFVTMTIATDNVKSTRSPNKWDIKSISAASLTLGMFFVIEYLLVLYLGINYFHLDWDRLRTLVMLSLVFNSQFRILIVRERKHFWSSMPNRNLITVNTITIIGFALLGIFGILVPKLAVNQVLIILGIAAVSMPCIDFVKYFLFKKFEL